MNKIWYFYHFTLVYAILTENVNNHFRIQMVPLPHTCLERCIPFICWKMHHRLLKYIQSKPFMNLEVFSHSLIKVLSRIAMRNFGTLYLLQPCRKTRAAHSFIYLNPEKGTPFGQSLSSRLFSRPDWLPLGLRGCSVEAIISFQTWHSR